MNIMNLEIVREVERFVREQQLLREEGQPVLVALSGGADSVALLHLLLALGYPCIAAHCNFHLRGRESDRDEAFVRSLCSRLGVTLHCTDFDTSRIAREQHLSIEMVARELRYRWFESLRERTGAQAVAVAHHRDDSVETLLLNLIRGTGIDGLRGIRPRNGHVVRPLLCISRSDILNYLQVLGEEFVTDSTNLHDDYTRNKIRLRLLPLMEEINPSVREALIRTAHHLDQAATLYHEEVAKGIRRLTCNAETPSALSIAQLLQEPEPELLLHEILSPLGFNEAQIGDVMKSLYTQPGKQFLSATHRVVRDRTLLLIEPLLELQPPTLREERLERTPDFVIPRDPKMACLDEEKLTAPLTLRLYRSGDRFYPFGMKGAQTVSRYLTNNKVPIHLKERQWVLCCGEEIVWVVGMRLDRRFAVGPNTQHIRLISCSSQE